MPRKKKKISIPFRKFQKLVKKGKSLKGLSAGDKKFILQQRKRQMKEKR